MMVREVAGQESQSFRELYASGRKASSEASFSRSASRLTRPGNCGKLDVYTARFLRLPAAGRLVRKQQARRKIARAIRILPAIEKIGKREKWTRSSYGISASSRTSTTANPRSPTACWK